MSITSYAQNFEDVMLWRALGHIEQGLYIDIGAQDPIIDSVSLAFHEHGWQGIHVEPTAHYAELLRQHRPGDTVIQAAVGQESAVLQFFEIPDTGISTADAAIAAQHRERGFNVQVTTVPSIPLAAIFKTCAEQEIHWLKIDVEGFEQQVLSSWGTSAARPWIVVVESTLPLTQIETHQSWESILTGHGYTSAYFDGLNRYYVSDAHPELKAAFASPPNVFDGFALNGTASAPFHQLIAARYQDKIAEAEQEKAALALKHGEQANALQHQHAEREQTLYQKLHALQEQLDRLQQERAVREKLLHEQNTQSRQELENLLRQLVQREQQVAAQLLKAQQQAEQEKAELTRSHSERARALHMHYAEREKALNEQLQTGQQELHRLQQEWALREKEHAEQNSQSRQALESQLRNQVQREQEIAVQLLNIQQRADQDKTELARSHSEQERALQREHADRQQVVAQQLQAAQETLRNLERDWAHNEKALGKEIAALQNEALALHHAQQLQAQRHDAELGAKLDEHKRLIAACATLEAQLKAEILFEQQTSLRLRQSLTEVQQSLATTHALLTWRMTAPLRTLASFIAPKKNPGSATPVEAEATDAIMAAAAAPKSINVQQAAVKPVEPISPANTHAANAHSPAHEMEAGVFPPAVMPPVSESQPINVRHAFIEPIMHSPAQVTMPPTPALASTLDELLAYHDQQFVHCAYQTLLGRAPDPEGLGYYLGRLRTGFLKIQILAQLRLSNEGRTYAAKLPGLDTAIQHHQKGRYPLIGWLFRRLNGTEGNHPTERKLRAIENQLALSNDESSRRFNQMDAALAGLHQLIVQQTQSVITALGGTHTTIPSVSSPPPIQPPDPDGLEQLSLRARTIYYQLKSAAASNAVRSA